MVLQLTRTRKANDTTFVFVAVYVIHTAADPQKGTADAKQQQTNKPHNNNKNNKTVLSAENLRLWKVVFLGPTENQIIASHA